MSKIAIIFDIDTDFKTASKHIDGVLAYIDNYEMQIDCIDLISDINVNIEYPDTDRVTQKTGDIGNALHNYNYVFGANSESLMTEILDVVDKYNIIYEKEDSELVSIGSLKGFLNRKYIDDAIVIGNNPEEINDFINYYLDAVLKVKDEEIVASIKEGLRILNEKADEQ